jgi:hypothetical protein
VGMIWAKHLMQSGFPSASSKNQGRKSKTCVDNFSDDSDVTLISSDGLSFQPVIFRESETSDVTVISSQMMCLWYVFTVWIKDTWRWRQAKKWEYNIMKPANDKW